MVLRREASKLMQVVTTSVENVKPFDGMTTIKTKKPFKLCLLDQLMGSFYTSFVFFYPDHHKRGASGAVAEELKASLSKTLDPFYPLAGRVRDNLVIDDFHAGVPFVVARATGQTLSEFLGPPKLDLLNDLVPFQPFCLPTLDQVNHGLPQLAVQMNTFDCGGVAIGLNFNHKIMDGGSVITFLHTWAGNSSGRQYYSEREGQTITPPDLTTASSVFPPQPSITPWDASLQNFRRTATRRFVFDEEAIASLRSRARSSQVESRPSRTEALSAFVWESALRSDRKLQCFAQAVNIRNRMGRRLYGHSIGNLFVTPLAFSRETTTTMKELARVLRRATVGVDESYLDSVSGKEGGEAMVEGMKLVAGKLTASQHNLTCTSWLQLDLRGFELAGLGKPVWVGMVGEARGTSQSSVENLMILKEIGGSSVNCGKVEAWIRLDEDVMCALERDPEFLEFASPNPPVIFN